MFKKLLQKILLIGCIITILSTSVFATTIEEKTFVDLGYQNETIEKDQNVCFEIFVPTLKNEINSNFVLVLEIENYIPVTKNVEIKVFLNDQLEKIINAKDIKKKNIVKMNNYNDHDNNISICINNEFLPRIIISKNSVVGNYLLAEITKDDIYQIVPSNITTETLIPIEIVFRNRGYNDIQVKVENATDEYIINNLLAHISGEYQYEGILEAGEEKHIKYFIKTKDDFLYLSPRAKITYTNEFGETIKIISEPALINAEKKEGLLDIFIDVPKEIVIQEKTPGIIILRNKTNETISNIFINKTSTESIEILNKSVNELKPNEIVEIPFNIKAFNKKDFKITFNTNYFSKNVEYNQSKTIDVTIKQKIEKIFEVVGAFVLIFIIIYIWFLKT
jgi:hypothetical protein